MLKLTCTTYFTGGLAVNAVLALLLAGTFITYLNETKIYVVGTQKNRLMVLLSTHNTCFNCCVRKYSHFFPQKCYFKIIMYHIFYRRPGNEWRICPPSCRHLYYVSVHILPGHHLNTSQDLKGLIYFMCSFDMRR